MKKSKGLLIIILCIFVFLILDKMRISMDITTLSKPEVVDSKDNIQNLIDYINNLELTDEKINEITENSKIILKDIKGKTSFSDYKLKEILKTYKSFSAIANNLNLKIDFSIKNGDFTLKEKNNGNKIFNGNVSEIKKYFKFIKENTAISSIEVLSDINTENSINTILTEIDKVNNTILSDDENYIKEENLNENNVMEENLIENEISNIDVTLRSNKTILLPITILILSFFITVITYIKLK